MTHCKGKSRSLSLTLSTANTWYPSFFTSIFLINVLQIILFILIDCYKILSFESEDDFPHSLITVPLEFSTFFLIYSFKKLVNSCVLYVGVLPAPYPCSACGGQTSTSDYPATWVTDVSKLPWGAGNRTWVLVQQQLLITAQRISSPVSLIYDIT